MLENKSKLVSLLKKKLNKIRDVDNVSIKTTPSYHNLTSEQKEYNTPRRVKPTSSSIDYNKLPSNKLSLTIWSIINEMTVLDQDFSYIIRIKLK